MTIFQILKDQINLLGRAEYQYDRLVSDFSEHYLELRRAGYTILLEVQNLHAWLAHLNRMIRPTLFGLWREVAERAGFSLGDLIEVEGVKIYAVKAGAYPDMDYVRFTGFGVRKDHSPSQASVSVNIKAETRVKKLGKSLGASVIELGGFKSEVQHPGFQ